MTINLDKLRTVLENAGEAWADGEHIDIITPPVVLELIAEIESLRTRFSGMRAGRDSERSRADVNANALERMEQRALGAEANLEAALDVSRDRLSRLEQAEQAVQRVREMSAHRKEIRLDYVDLIDLDRALDGDGLLPADDALGGGQHG